MIESNWLNFVLYKDTAPHFNVPTTPTATTRPPPKHPTTSRSLSPPQHTLALLNERARLLEELARIKADGLVS